MESSSVTVDDPSSSLTTVAPTCVTEAATIRREGIEGQLADLEKASASVIFTDAESMLCAVVELVEPGSEIVVSTDIDSKTCAMLSRLLWQRGVTVWCVDPIEVPDAVSERTGLVYLQLPGGSQLRQSDLDAVAERTARHGALLVVDGTFANPESSSPLDAGADVSLRTNARLLAGGAVDAGVASVTDPVLADRLVTTRARLGATPDAGTIDLFTIGLPTLSLRLTRQEATARRLATFLSVDPAIRRVAYPGLASRRTTASRTRGGGITLIFEPKNPLVARRFATSVRRFKIGEPFDGARSTLTVSESGTRTFPEIDRHKPVEPVTVRLTIGLEDSDDLLRDVANALAASVDAPTRASA